MPIPPISPKVLSFETKSCDLKKPKGRNPHNITKSGLYTDPLSRMKFVNGKATTTLMHLCESCYRTALSQKRMKEGRECDLKVKGDGKITRSPQQD